MVLTWVVLAGWCAATTLCLTRPGPILAIVLAVVSGIWMPVNNGHLEGPVLITFDQLRGMTLADLISVAGFVVAYLALWRWWRAQPRKRPAQLTRGFAAVSAVLGFALVFTWLAQPA
ncbi:MAG: hypothetical protein JO147_11425 [Actinobacteria bacterium]|nr:hypothetical protein [Actinomycetota bacterium]